VEILPHFVDSIPLVANLIQIPPSIEAMQFVKLDLFAARRVLVAVDFQRREESGALLCSKAGYTWSYESHVLADAADSFVC
jgi:hypothetical protein